VWPLPWGSDLNRSTHHVNIVTICAKLFCTTLSSFKFHERTGKCGLNNFTLTLGVATWMYLGGEANKLDVSLCKLCHSGDHLCQVTSNFETFISTMSYRADMKVLRSDRRTDWQTESIPIIPTTLCGSGLKMCKILSSEYMFNC
jgi:hypothetical protein